METYFEAMEIEDGQTSVGTFFMYLVVVCLLWCDNQCVQPIRYLEEFKEVFHKKFHPNYAKNEA